MGQTNLRLTALLLLCVVGGQGSARKITRLNFCFILTERARRHIVYIYMCIHTCKQTCKHTYKPTKKTICILCLFYCSALGGCLPFQHISFSFALVYCFIFLCLFFYFFSFHLLFCSLPLHQVAPVRLQIYARTHHRLICLVKKHFWVRAWRKSEIKTASFVCKRRR